MTSRFSRFILDFPGRLAMPIGINAGLPLIDTTIRQALNRPQVQVDAVLALHERFHTQVLLTAMDLSAEAEAFGSTIRMEETEVPTVTNRLVTDRAEIEALKIPAVGDKRMRVHLDAAAQLAHSTHDMPVLGGLIGPFSLAARLFGVSELLETTATDPDLVLTLLEKVTGFLSDYTKAFKRAGCWGAIMAEPAAGLLSPRSLAAYSSCFVHQILSEVNDDQFTVVLHNCGAKITHFSKVLESGAEIYHFGAPMDLAGAFEQMKENPVILSGNLDPSAVFNLGTAQEVHQQTLQLLDKVGKRKNFVISSGCDLPPGVPFENIEAFFETVANH